MSKKIDPRIPKEVGSGSLKDYPAINSPWGKLMSFHDTFYYVSRHKAVIAANFNQVVRILIPDYEARNQKICDVESRWAATAFGPPLDKYMSESRNIHPFIKGGSTSAFFSDSGDEDLLMRGRVNDYGTYRVEKELDCCPWDIVGSECCRASMMTTQRISDMYGEPDIELNMVEAKGCGDLHCRVVAENRTKFPVPGSDKKPIWECLGPIATEDQIKFTPEEKMIKEPQMFTEECNYEYQSPLCMSTSPTQAFFNIAPQFLGCNYTNNLLVDMVKTGELDETYLKHVITCIFEASGKTAYGEFYAIKGLRDWMGVPEEINDGRVLGGLIEMCMQARMIKYEIIAFNKDEVIYDIDKVALEPFAYIAHAYVAMWHGMSKTLISTQWAAWEETDDVPEGMLRIKIAKKIDKRA